MRVYAHHIDGHPIHQIDDGVQIRVWLVPGARKPGLAGLHGGRLKLRVASPASEGRANREAERFLSAMLGVDAILVGGETRRDKMFEVRGIGSEAAQVKLGL